MPDVFITKIHIDKVRHLHDVEIALSETERKHLILTGKNGSGKTSLLEAMRDRIIIWQNHIGKSKRPPMPAIEINFSQERIDFYSYTFIYTGAHKDKIVKPSELKAVKIDKKSSIATNVNDKLEQYILMLDYQRYGAQENGDKSAELTRKEWFINFEKALCEIFDCRELKVKSDTANLSFNIIMPDREPFALHEMSDGYTAFIEIYMELVMRLANDDALVAYNTPAIVLIDEIDAHLHVELQRRVLPFLTRMFPNAQFIVTTHSPFVINSVDNAVVFDLETNTRIDDAHMFSYSEIVDGYYDVEQNSDKLWSDFERYKELSKKDNRTADEKAELMTLRTEMIEKIAPSNPDMYLAFKQYERKCAA